LDWFSNFSTKTDVTLLPHALLRASALTPHITARVPVVPVFDIRARVTTRCLLLHCCRLPHLPLPLALCLHTPLRSLLLAAALKNKILGSCLESSSEGC